MFKSIHPHHFRISPISPVLALPGIEKDISFQVIAEKAVYTQSSGLKRLVSEMSQAHYFLPTSCPAPIVGQSTYTCQNSRNVCPFILHVHVYIHLVESASSFGKSQYSLCTRHFPCFQHLMRGDSVVPQSSLHATSPLMLTLNPVALII